MVKSEFGVQQSLDVTILNVSIKRLGDIIRIDTRWLPYDQLDFCITSRGIFLIFLFIRSEGKQDIIGVLQRKGCPVKWQKFLITSKKTRQWKNNK